VRFAPADVPVTPDAPTARRWALEELARPEYHHQESLLSRLIEWITRQFDGVGTHLGLSGAQAALVIVGVLAVVVLIAFWVAGPVRRSRRVATAGAVRAHDDVRTAAQLRAAADAAVRAGDFSLAVVERFRALVRGLEERLVVDERAARTADEAALDAGRRLPELAGDLVTASALFDDVAYGGRSATADDERRVHDLDVRAQATRPVREQPAAVTV